MSSHQMDTEWLRTFLAAAESGNFREAGRRRYITQAAVSQQIARLEEELGARLFDRRARRVILNPTGAQFRDYAERLVTLWDKSRDQVHVQSRQERLCLIADSFMAEAVVPWLCRQLFREIDDLDVVVRPYTPELLASANWDAALLTDPPIRPGWDMFRLFMDSVELMVSHDGGEIDRPPPDAWDWIRRRRLIEPETAAYWPDVLARLEARGIMPRSMRVNQLGAVKRLTEEGVGITFLPRLVVRRELIEGRILALEAEGLGTLALQGCWLTPRDQRPSQSRQLAEDWLRRRWPEGGGP